MVSHSRPLAVEQSFEVKTYDVDFVNIVHNMVYIRWLEDLRLQLLTAHYPLEAVLAAGQSPILIRTEIDYRYPVRFGDRVMGHMWLSDLSRVRWTVSAEIFAGDKLAASSVQQGYFADRETLRPIRIPQALQQKWLADR